ncbi:hypothetical protein SOVF_159860 [Spinacia oleracea]|uniref:Uncharacterized protein LOC110781102 n=1 Tax=Spinacia oleracea TaxID=3562 RepID=A0A9R0JNA3_SPIOL|nr:uncharacterized protein LOC110781102 [Spinacia oleracea]XP_021841050.1 uncharacterized protein LOC110781102 [Spinacia oleracea]XP_021841054.1 uncharacterized protein LOC110781102 [Spinacia oleracea]KNA08749.1 hypothetical protein SOVF_159860 [Spinacia oleracea]
MNTQTKASSSPHQQQLEEEEEEASLSPTQLLQIARTHLRLRNFSLSRQYALESQQPNDPNSQSNSRHASQILAISNILSSPTNFYSILQIDAFCSDFVLIRAQFKHLLSLLDPIEEKCSMAKEALNLVWKAYDCLSDPTKKAQFDSKLGDEDVGKGTTFWTFCPYCFYMYQYPRVYEGCCLRCQNQTCRRCFHAVALNSLPKMELDKGRYFSCFGYFPLGFAPGDGIGGEKSGKFDSWSPIVGMFPMRRIGKTLAGRLDGIDSDNNPDIYVDCTNFIEIADESEESENDEEGEIFGSNVGKAGTGMKRKSVARNARKLMSSRRSSEGGDYDANAGEDEENGLEGDHGDVGGGGSGFESEDVAFFEENGEIFVEFGPDSAL